MALQSMNLTSDSTSSAVIALSSASSFPSHFLSLYIPAKGTCVISSLGTFAPAALLKDMPRAGRKLIKLVACNISRAIIAREQWL